MMENNKSNSVVVTFLIGAAVGAAVAVLLAPQSGAKLRRTIGRYASDATDEVRKRGQEAIEQGKEYLEDGKDLLKRGKDYAREGEKAVRERTESMQRRS